MDSSIRPQVVKGVLGELSWRPEDLSSAEWHEVTTAILKKNAALIEYLPGYKPIKDWTQKSPGSGHDRSLTSMATVKVLPTLALETKCIRITRLSHKVEGDAREMHTLGYGCRFAYEKDLYLTHKGRFVLSDRKYERVFESRQDKPGRTYVTETTHTWSFSLCEGKALEATLTPKLAIDVLDALGTCAAGGVRERRDRLQCMQNFHEELQEVSIRLNHYNSWHSA